MNPVAEQEGWYSAVIDAACVIVAFYLTDDSYESEILKFNPETPYYKNGAWQADFNVLEYRLAIARQGESGVEYETLGTLEAFENQFMLVYALDADIEGIVIVDSLGNVYNNYQEGCDFVGTTTVAGEYTFYLKPDENYLIWVNVQENADVGYYIYLDFTQLAWFDDDNALIYGYVWYADESKNDEFPGVLMTGDGDTICYVEYDSEKTVVGVIFVRCNPENNAVWNRIELGDLEFDPENNVYYATAENDGYWAARA
jgi:hypothetical protein